MIGRCATARSDAEGIVLVAGAALIGKAALHQAAKRALGLNAVTGLRQGNVTRIPILRKGQVLGFCQTDQPSTAIRRKTLSRSSMVSIRSSLRSRWTS